MMIKPIRLGLAMALLITGATFAQQNSAGMNSGMAKLSSADQNLMLEVAKAGQYSWK